MAARKKEDIQPVYPESALTISREKFCDLLREQIGEGEALLNINVPVVPQMPRYGGYASYSSDVKYDESAENEFIAKYNQWNDRNKTIYRTSFKDQESIYFHEYESHIWHTYFGGDHIKHIKDEIKRLMNHLEGDIKRSDLIKCDIIEDIPAKLPKIETNKVFIVHGHDHATRTEVELMVKQLGFEPVVLFKQPSRGDTIIEKLLREASNAAFAIVLYTKCDEGKAVEETDLKPRARQNVVFEHGLMCGLIGRNKVVALVEEGVEVPGDLSGVVYITLDSAKRWQFDVAREMKASGLSVDLNKLFE